MLIPLADLQKKYGLKITGILHVGAHLCEEREAYLQTGVSDAQIYWIEGNQDIAKQVHERDPVIKIIPALVSDTNQTLVHFIVTNNGQSSSILELDEHKVEHPSVIETERRLQKTTRLDTLIPKHKIDMTHINFLNIDIQGAELLALRGLGRYLNFINYIYVEVNIKSLYKDCALLPELDEFLQLNGFVQKELFLTHYGWGDAFYIRRDII